jgi:hypothetical protein
MAAVSGLDARLRRRFAPKPVSPSRPTSLRRALALVAVAAVAAGVVWIAVEAEPSPAVLLVVAIVVVIIVALVGKAAVSGLDPFEPLVVFGLMWLIMFALRPAAMLVSGDLSLRETYDAGPGLDRALALALLGAVAFVGGYIRWRPNRVREAGRRWRTVQPIPNLAYLPTICLIAVFGLAAVAFLANSFGRNLGRSAYVNYAPLLATPVTLLLLTVRGRLQRPRRLAAFALTGLVVANYWLIGERFFGLLPITSVVLFLYLEKGRRPRFAAVVLLSVVLSLTLVAIQSQRPGAAAQTPHTSLAGQFTLGGTTEELPALAVEIESRNVLWHQQPGYLAYSLLVHWIPGGLWPNKPKSYAELLYSRLFPANYAVSRADTEFSVLGDFYYDSGPIGVLVGMACLGLVVRAVYDRLNFGARTALGLAAYAPFPALLVILMRGDLTLVAGVFLYVYSPFIVAAIVARRTGHVSAEALGRGVVPPSPGRGKHGVRRRSDAGSAEIRWEAARRP